jgi:hypothetical protein
VGWLSVVAVALLGWLLIAVAVGTIVGHGAALGTGYDRDY